MRIGTDITKAKALAPKLITGDSYPAAETKGLTELALRALQRIFPVVMVDPRDGLVIDATRSDQLHGGSSAPLRASRHLEPQRGSIFHSRSHPHADQRINHIDVSFTHTTTDYFQ